MATGVALAAAQVLGSPVIASLPSWAGLFASIVPPSVDESVQGVAVAIGIMPDLCTAVTVGALPAVAPTACGSITAMASAMASAIARMQVCRPSICFDLS